MKNILISKNLQPQHLFLTKQRLKIQSFQKIQVFKLFNNLKIKITPTIPIMNKIKMTTTSKMGLTQELLSTHKKNNKYVTG
jgi:hypothetical protein